MMNLPDILSIVPVSIARQVHQDSKLRDTPNILPADKRDAMGEWVLEEHFLQEEGPSLMQGGSLSWKVFSQGCQSIRQKIRLCWKSKSIVIKPCRADMIFFGLNF